MTICAEEAGTGAMRNRSKHTALVSNTRSQSCAAVRLRRKTYSTSIEQQRVLSAHLMMIQPLLQRFNGSIFGLQLCSQCTAVLALCLQLLNPLQYQICFVTTQSVGKQLMLYSFFIAC